MRLPDELRRTIEQRSKRGKWMFYFLIPVLLAAVLGTNLLRPEPAPAILFLYSVVLASIPVALFPVRGRMLKDYITQQQNPDIKIKPDRLTMTWIAGFMSTVMLGAELAGGEVGVLGVAATQDIEADSGSLEFQTQAAGGVLDTGAGRGVGHVV